jgi:1-piperideine-2-carboxylate/1-pyrroline-2-carboxylate reductase [NAD(P)H]
MTSSPIVICNREQTAELLDFPALINALSIAALEYAKQKIISPERMVVPTVGEGLMLSMPATSADIAIHKLVNVQTANFAKGIPTIHGQVSVYDAETGAPICLLDGPEVTGRRTAALSMLAIKTLLPAAPEEILIVGTGIQAAYHVKAINAVHPHARVCVRGLTFADAASFCETNQAIHAELYPTTILPEDASVVITLTTSKKPVYNEKGRAGRLIIGVGAFTPEMAEIGGETLSSSHIYVDDPAGVRHEAGDLIQARIDWSEIRSIAQALQSKPDLTVPIVFKSVGSGAWDLAACRVARSKLNL